jgi:hypothetical protein
MAMVVVMVVMATMMRGMDYKQQGIVVLCGML